MLINKIKKLRLETKQYKSNFNLSTKETYNDNSYSNMILSNTTNNSA